MDIASCAGSRLAMHRRAARLVRWPTAVLLTAILALAAPAANLEIPASVLTQEGRSRAAFTPVERARAQALEARLSSKMSINDANALTRGETAGVAFAVLLAYLKILQKEARDDEKIAGIAAKESLAAKQGKLDLEKAKIEAMKREAAERFDHAMSAATVEMAIGIVACAAAAATLLTGPHTARALPGVAAPIVAPAAAPGVSVPTRTPTKVPGAGK
jgi:hypothetical protein